MGAEPFHSPKSTYNLQLALYIHGSSVAAVHVVIRVFTVEKNPRISGPIQTCCSRVNCT